MRLFVDRDLTGGAILLVVGMAASYVAITSYPLGTIQRMGPGMFPAGLGVILAGLGALQIVLAWRQPRKAPEIRIFSPILILASIAAFAIVIGPFGLVPAIVSLIFVASAAELRLRLMDMLLLSVGLSLLAPFVFSFCLGLPITLVSWPF